MDEIEKGGEGGEGREGLKDNEKEEEEEEEEEGACKTKQRQIQVEGFSLFLYKGFCHAMCFNWHVDNRTFLCQRLLLTSMICHALILPLLLSETHY